ncbi:MAG: type II toxin-antitoxin system HipA family toxin [Cyanobacteria bacterium]|nr:type II toxin-antitoxin system HipA family toxin [Cyanobacteriota bacterium]MDA1021009.1 type II toxin-antitoxin system HipA family toxin [Cyanobacteriota bacterium]
MADNSWAKVYFRNKESLAGILEQRPGGDYLFVYDEEFQKQGISISTRLPVSRREHLSQNVLHPFFDNLIAEGPLAKMQAKAIGAKETDRFKLLMAFGYDLIGAVTIVDPNPNYEIKIDTEDYFHELSLRARASISGVQPKLLVVKKGTDFHPVIYKEASTHIAKLSGGQYPLIVENEFLTMKTTEILLFNDQVAEVEISELEGLGQTLFVKRFDRNANGEKLAFEEFTQLLNIESSDKYDGGTYQGMADYMNQSRLCTKADVEKLLRRILACILLGNTDAHLKNFAMFREKDALNLTPIYDMVFANYYDGVDYMALSLRPNEDKPKMKDLKSKHLQILSESFGFSERVLLNIVKDFEKRLDLIYQFIESETQINSGLRNKFKEYIEKRWNGLFSNIGQK